jgi:glucosamine-6-phosphate deaminase
MPGTRDNVNIHVFENRTLLGEAAAAEVAQTIRQLHTTQDAVNIVFAAAPSQNEFLAALLQHSLDWHRINAFHMDEYLGLGSDAPQSFGYYLKTHCFDKRPFQTVNLLDGLSADARSECFRYSVLLEAFPTDIVCLGIGENNHLAFNDPPVANFRDPETVKVVTLDVDCRQQQVNDGCFPTFEAVPTQALTLTIPALMAGRHLFAMVPGPRKAPAVANTFNNPVTERFPSTILRQHPAVHLYLDRDSSKLLEL